jgi:hypothetical protein
VSASRVRPVLLLFVLCGLLAGCAGTTPDTSRVHVSVTAPTDGATVVVPRIVLLATVEPRTAVVEVSGRRVRVTNGVFKRAVLLRRRLTHIKIVARAPGAVASTTTLSIRYTPPRRRASRGARAGSRSGSPLTPGVQAPTTGISGADLSPSLAAGFMEGCSSSGGSITGCACIWRQLSQRGFGSVGQFEALVERWRRSFATQGVIGFPPVVRSAVLSCAAQFHAP